MKKINLLLIIAFLLGCTKLSAQEKRFRFEMGLNYPISFEKDGYKENHIAYYFAETYNFKNSPLSIDLKLSCESYTYTTEGTFEMLGKIHPTTYNFDANSLSLIPSINYNWRKHKWIKSYVGIGMGASIDNLYGEVFNKGHHTHLAIVPKAGIQLFNHINLSAQYYITQEESSRLMINLGYQF